MKYSIALIFGFSLLLTIPIASAGCLGYINFKNECVGASDVVDRTKPLDSTTLQAQP